MFININEQMDIFICTFDVEVNNQRQRETMQAPRMMLEHRFMSLVQQAAQSPTPIKIKMSIPVYIYDESNNEEIERESSVTFTNNAYIDKYGEG